MTEPTKQYDEFVVKYRRESKPRAIDMKELEKCLSKYGRTVEWHIEWLMRNYGDDLEFVALANWTDEGLIYAEKKNGKELMEKKSE